MYGDFGDLALTLLRVSVENFANSAYIYGYIRKLGPSKYEEAVTRFLGYGDIQLLKLANVGQDIMGQEFVDRMRRSGDFDERMKELKAKEQKFMDDYYGGQKPRSMAGTDLDLTSRLRKVKQANLGYLDSKSIDLAIAYLPELNSKIHSDAHCSRTTITLDEIQMRESRRLEGEQAVGISTLLSINCFRIAADVLGLGNELKDQEDLEFERAQCFEWAGVFERSCTI